MTSGRRRTGISEIGGPDAETEADAAELERQPIGSYLRRQRKLRGISIEDLARATRIPLRSLQRLEGGSFDDDVDGFVRGFVRTVADALGLDPDDTLARMLAEPAVDESQPFHLSQSLPRALVGLLVVVAVAAAVGVVHVVATGNESVEAGGTAAKRIYRRDPVRALAESQSAAAADSLPRAEPSPAATEPRPAPEGGVALGPAASVVSAPPTAAAADRLAPDPGQRPR
jgi:cytoskeletal protein RodZ